MFPQQFAGTHLYTWMERGTVRVKCLAQELNTMSLAKAQTRAARSGVERTNHEATAPPVCLVNNANLPRDCQPEKDISSKVTGWKSLKPDPSYSQWLIAWKHSKMAGLQWLSLLIDMKARTEGIFQDGN